MDLTALIGFRSRGARIVAGGAACDRRPGFAAGSLLWIPPGNVQDREVVFADPTTGPCIYQTAHLGEQPVTLGRSINRWSDAVFISVTYSSLVRG